MTMLRAGAVFFAILATVQAGHAIRGAQKTTPTQQVVNLLRDMVSHITATGKDEAERYDKFACFCKEQASDKENSITNSLRRIDGWKALVEKLDIDIAHNNKDISQLSEKISKLRKAVKDAVEKRTAEHASYAETDRKMVNAIEDLKGAIATLKASRTSDLLQVKQAVGRALNTANEDPNLFASDQPTDLLKSLSMFADPGKPHAYEFRSNDIIETLQDLSKKFIKNKTDLDHDEFELKAEFETRKASNERRIKNAENEKQKKEQQVESDTERKESTKQMIEEETAAKDADRSFIEELQVDCQDKAKVFDQRSATRSNELVALNQAIETLMSGKVPMSLLQGSSSSKHSPAKALSFLQAREETQPMERVLKLLSTAAKKTHSTVLTEAAVKVRLSKDHFVKVRQLIEDLIGRLEAQHASEKSLKAYCDKEMEKAIGARDSAQMTVEDYVAKLKYLESLHKKLTNDIAEDNQVVADTKRSISEMTDLRNEEHDDNMKTIEVAKGGEEAVKFALQVLKDFYEKGQGVALAQQAPVNADRDGQTVGELAPTTHTSSYTGAKGAASTIIGLLETILSDLQGDEDSADSTEHEAQAAYDKDKQAADDRIADKNRELETEGANDQAAVSDLAETQDNLGEAEEELKDTKDTHFKTKAMCVDQGETYEEKVAAREKEIQSLKDASQILREMQP